MFEQVDLMKVTMIPIPKTPQSYVEIPIGVKTFSFNNVKFSVTNRGCHHCSREQFESIVKISSQFIGSADTILWNGNDYHNELLLGDSYFDLRIDFESESLVVTAI